MNRFIVTCFCFIIFWWSCSNETEVKYRVWECRDDRTFIDTIVIEEGRQTFCGSKIGETHFIIDTLIKNNFGHFKDNRTLETNGLFLVCLDCPYQLEDNKKWYGFTIDSIGKNNGANFDFEIFFDLNFGSLGIFRLGQYVCNLDFIIFDNNNKRDTMFIKNDIPLYPPPPPPPINGEE